MRFQIAEYKASSVHNILPDDAHDFLGLFVCAAHWIDFGNSNSKIFFPKL